MDLVNCLSEIIKYVCLGPLNPQNIVEKYCFSDLNVLLSELSTLDLSQNCLLLYTTRASNYDSD